MSEQQKKWVNTMCKALDGYLEVNYPPSDENWDAAVSFIEVIVSISKGFKDEVRSALFEITTKWELKQRNENI